MNPYIKLKRRYSTPVWIRLFGELLTSMTGSMLAPFLIIYLHDKLGGNVLLPMIIVGLQPLSEIVITLFSGGITDRIGRRTIILIGLFLQAGAMAGFIVVDSVMFFAILYCLNGIGRSLYIPVQRAQIADSTEEVKRSEVFAVINTVGGFGATVGPLLGFLVYSSNPSIVFAFEATALFLYFLLVLLKMPETAPVHVVEPKGTNNTNKIRLPLRKLFARYHVVLGLMALTLPVSFFYAQTETNYRIYIQDLFPNYLFILSALYTCNAIMGIVLEIGLVKWTNGLSMGKVVIISYTCFAIGALLYGHTTHLFGLIVAQLILVIGESIGLNHFLGFVSKLAPDNMRGRYFAIYGTHWDISRSAGPVIGGVVLLHFGGAFLFYLAALLLVLGGIGQYFFVRYIEIKIPFNKNLKVQKADSV